MKRSIFTSTNFRIYRAKNNLYVVADLKSGKRFGSSYKTRAKAIARVAELELDIVIAELSTLADLWLLPELAA